jgi:hypothetical protein
LKIAKAQAILTLTATSATTNEITVSQSGISNNPYFLLSGMTFIVASDVGGLTAGTIYWILDVTGSSTFTASETPPDANVNQTPVALSTTTGGSVAVSVGVVDAYFNNPATGTGYPAASLTTYGVVGGNTAIYGTQVLAQVAIGNTQIGTITTSNSSTTVIGAGTDFANTTVNGTGISTSDGVFIGFVTDAANTTATSVKLAANAAATVTGSSFVIANDENGYIVRQKGKTKYLVKGLTTGLTGACYTANTAGAALQPGQMNITANTGSANRFVQSLSDNSGLLFRGTLPTIEEANAVFVTFNSAASADEANGIPYPIVKITGE